MGILKSRSFLTAAVGAKRPFVDLSIFVVLHVSG
jgi:hypothetical protein